MVVNFTQAEIQRIETVLGTGNKYRDRSDLFRTLVMREVEKTEKARSRTA